ncbi:EamA family transporter [Candidatus Bathyarchaeota archaeon]|nr:EamA family transporter [Candidatus Bathyarchaeota archaeon]
MLALLKKNVQSRLQVKLIAAFAAVYIIWGSTYLAIRIAIETIPPFFMAGTHFLWADGSLYSRSAQFPSSPLLATAMQMMSEGLLLFLASVATGEWLQIRLDMVSSRSLFSWIYLVVFGGLVALTSYIWLLKATAPARVSTYAYVNPIVAMFLGWVLADEPLIPRNILAAAIILTAVILITTYQKKERTMYRINPLISGFIGFQQRVYVFSHVFALIASLQYKKCGLV